MGESDCKNDSLLVWGAAADSNQVLWISDQPQYRFTTAAELIARCRMRRVIGKAEYLSKGPNPRFVVTSLTKQEMSAVDLYEGLYCARGDMENRIKEQQLCLFADRTSTATMRANQIRLYFSSIAYTLMHALRRIGLRATDMAKARCDTIRLKLLKIGAQIRVTVRNVWVSLSEGYPYLPIFARAYDNLVQFRLRC